MKKTLLMFALGLGLATFAQESKPQQHNGKHNGKQNMGQMKNMTPEQRQQKHMDMLTKELNLDAGQQQKVSALMAERNAKMKDLKAQKDALDAKGTQASANDKKALRKQMMDQKNDFESKMKGVLSTDQYTKWMGMREENKDKMMEHHQNMKMQKNQK